MLERAAGVAVAGKESAAVAVAAAVDDWHHSLVAVGTEHKETASN